MEETMSAVESQILANQITIMEVLKIMAQTFSVDCDPRMELSTRIRESQDVIQYFEEPA